MRKTAKKNAAAVELAKLRAKKLSPERRSEIASNAGKARLSTLSAEQRSAVARLGGKAGGKARAKPTLCPRCGKLQPTARAAWVHCRKPRKGTG